MGERARMIRLRWEPASQRRQGVEFNGFLSRVYDMHKVAGAKCTG
jgi:hypothetical protein